MVAVNGEVIAASPRWRVRRRLSLRVNVVYGVDEVLGCDGVVSGICSIADSWTCSIMGSETGDTSCDGDWPGESAMCGAIGH